jgi:hypothetical protein
MATVGIAGSRGHPAVLVCRPGFHGFEVCKAGTLRLLCPQVSSRTVSSKRFGLKLFDEFSDPSKLSK